ncbi:thioesterase II family protein [Kitasatospora sp. NPDC059673]|uniref:thioesterase II family protein n=1 Tax=Kitasatospora sp. NPDC059673 TaxID=3346901 RepID=UPI0036C1D5A0
MTASPARARAGSWFDDRFRSARAEFSLFCFPFAGGTAAYYASWAAAFAGDVVELVPVQPPGRGARMSEPGAESITAMAEEVAALIAGSGNRILLLGHSMGAITAFEVARRLERLGRPAEFLTVSGRPSPVLTRPLSPVSTLPRGEFVEMLREYGAAPDEVLAHEELLDVLIPMMRADFAMIEGYRYSPGPALSCPVRAWCGSRDPEVTPADMRGWGAMTENRFELSVRPGGHFFLTDHRNEVAAEVLNAVAALG